MKKDKQVSEEEKKYEDILKKLETTRVMSLGLERVRAAAARIGNPQDKYPTIHVAGTNGKGSTSTMIASILKESGKTVGLFISPYLSDFRESITINGKMIGKHDVIELYGLLENENLTFFEIKTMMAFKYFEKMKVDYAVIEVGLGGRLDATNIIRPVASVITSISIDHIDYLGDKIEKIAFEKAGIIKEGVPLIVHKDCRGIEVIKEVCKEKISTIINPIESWLYDEYGNDMYPLKMKGSFQKENKLLAIAFGKMFCISDKAIKEGLSKAYIKGRLEERDGILFDCAHNADGVKKVIKDIDDKKICIISIMKDKEYGMMLREIENIAHHIIFTRVNERSADPQALKNISKTQSTVVEEPKKAMDIARELSKKTGCGILVIGSCYLVGKLLDSE